MDSVQRILISDIVIPDRPTDGHKGTFGKVLVIAGSIGMSGAACLAATAALRGGAGLVYAAVPESIQSLVAGFEPSYLTIGLPCSSGGLLSAVPPGQVTSIVEGRDAVAIGPGLGRSHHAANIVLSVMNDAPCPVVVDADALNLAAEHGVWSGQNDPTPASDLPARVLTPHPGEFSRMSGLSISEVNADREGAAVEFARRANAIVVLKGAGTVVTDGQRVYINSTGNEGMGTGGCGDVLTGLLAAQLGQGIPAFAAACLAVYIHGFAADLAAVELSRRGLIASDVLKYLGSAWLQFERSLPD
ncbi:MAG: NAD(P)H-hydrate dehydratase [Planctomycetaceae bacterium]